MICECGHDVNRHCTNYQCKPTPHCGVDGCLCRGFREREKKTMKIEIQLMDAKKTIKYRSKVIKLLIPLSQIEKYAVIENLWNSFPNRDEFMIISKKRGFREKKQ